MASPIEFQFYFVQFVGKSIIIIPIYVYRLVERKVHIRISRLVFNKHKNMNIVSNHTNSWELNHYSLFWLIRRFAFGRRMTLQLVSPVVLVIPVKSAPKAVSLLKRQNPQGASHARVCVRKRHTVMTACVCARAAKLAQMSACIIRDKHNKHWPIVSPYTIHSANYIQCRLAGWYVQRTHTAQTTLHML